MGQEKITRYYFLMLNMTRVLVDRRRYKSHITPLKEPRIGHTCSMRTAIENPIATSDDIISLVYFK